MVVLYTDPDFIASVEGLLAEKGLEKSDLQVYIKKEDIDDAITDLIGKDWYSFGKCMNITSDILDKIKENTTLKERKAALLNLLIEHHKIRFEDIIYGHYTMNRQSLFISHILNYVASQRITRGIPCFPCMIFYFISIFQSQILECCGENVNHKPG